MTRRLYYNGLSRPLGVHLFLVSRRQRKRSTSNKIRVQRLINITQNRAPPDHTDCVWLFPVSLALPFRLPLSLSSLELELHYFYFYRAGSYNSAADFCLKKNKNGCPSNRLSKLATHQR